VPATERTNEIPTASRLRCHSTGGIDAQTETYVDMIRTGIVDSAKVVRTALQDAGSISALLITAEAMIAHAPQKDAPTAGNGGGIGY
jgi:chaperonin GroEL